MQQYGVDDGEYHGGGANTETQSEHGKRSKDWGFPHRAPPVAEVLQDACATSSDRYMIHHDNHCIL
jgi:hypothetical protein